MKWLSAMVIGAIVAVILPLFLGGEHGAWMDSWAAWGTIRPSARSPGLLFSIPLFVVSALALRLFFSWHSS